MEWFLHHFADIFRYSTGFLIAWGIFASHTIFKTILYSHKERGLIRKVDALYLLGLVGCTSFLICSLFVFSSFVTEFMFALFVFEVWYGMFAAYFTAHYLQPCLNSYLKHRLMKPRPNSKLHR